VCADGITVHIHPQAFEVERGTVSCHMTLDPHCRRVADPVMLRAEWTTDVYPVTTYLFLTPVHLVVVRGVSEHRVIGKQAHHQVKVLIWEDAAGDVEHYLDVPDREDVRGRAAIALRLGERRQARQQRYKWWDLAARSSSFTRLSGFRWLAGALPWGLTPYFEWLDAETAAYTWARPMQGSGHSASAKLECASGFGGTPNSKVPEPRPGGKASMTEPAKAVFLSHASQDAEAAARICYARAGRIEVWFGQSELRGGDAWDREIRKQIRPAPRINHRKLEASS
jgi:hypothetical protein